MKIREYIQIVGAGKRRARDMTVEEAYLAMREILEGHASEVQISAFLMALRVKGESSDELKGFIKAIKEDLDEDSFDIPKNLITITPPFDGKNKTPLLTPSVAIILATLNQPVLVLSSLDVPPKYGVTTLDLFNGLELNTAKNKKELEEQLNSHNICVADINVLFPALDNFTKVRGEFHLRTVLSTLEKLLTFKNSFIITSYKHSTYLDSLKNSLSEFYSQALIVQGSEGSPDLYISKRTKYTKLCVGSVEDKQVNPEELEIDIKEETDFLKCTKKCSREFTNDFFTGNMNNKSKESIFITASLYLYENKNYVSLKEAHKAVTDAYNKGLIKEKYLAIKT